MTAALVTGASSGIGREFARQLAERQSDLVLVARDRKPLESVALELGRDHGVVTEVMVADLSDRTQTAQVAVRLADPTRPVDILINDAGGGPNRPFLVNDVGSEQMMLRLMGETVLTLTHAAARGMVDRRRGAIVNVSSLSSFLTLGTYSATKAWVRIFSEGLAAELSGTGVTCTAVCPGFTHTAVHERSGASAPGLPSFMWLEPSTVVRRALDDAKRGRVVSVPGAQYRFMASVAGSLPRPLVRRLSRGMVTRQPTTTTLASTKGVTP